MEGLEPFEFNDLINSSNLGPMPPIGTDLSNVFLLSEQRMWLARQVLSGARKPTELGRQWNLSRHRVWKYAKKVSDNKIPGEKHGRPRALDSVAWDHLRSRVVADGIRDREILNADCDFVYTDTHIRRQRFAFEEQFDPVDMLDMNERTRRKYVSAALA